ncbi:MAG: hypothetical protein IIA65_10350 [Planctomycetes bacterium]|nr:hypothetical protein [Planctomycetota bacterium]
MSHLTDEEFEDLLQGQESGRDHLDRCRRCQDRLAEKRALAMRLRDAFAAVTPEADLSQRIRSGIGLGTDRGQSAKPGPHVVKISGHRRRVWTTGLSAVAAILLVAFVVALALTPSAAQATQSTLAGIHAINLLVGEHEFWADTDPEKLTTLYGEVLGVEPYLPPVTETLKLCSCCVKRSITEHVVGSYVVGTAEGVMTVAIVRPSPESLGKGRAGPGGRIYYEAMRLSPAIKKIRRNKKMKRLYAGDTSAYESPGQGCSLAGWPREREDSSSHRMFFAA